MANQYTHRPKKNRKNAKSIEKPSNQGDGDRRRESSVVGTVMEALPNAMFRLELADGRLVLSYLSGKMHLHKIRVLVGDRVEVALDQYGERGRITRRL